MERNLHDKSMCAATMLNEDSPASAPESKEVISPSLNKLHNVAHFVGYALLTFIAIGYVWGTSNSTTSILRNIFFILGSSSLAYVNFTGITHLIDYTTTMNRIVATGHISIILYALITIVQVVIEYDFAGHTLTLPKSMFGMPYIPKYPVDGILLLFAHAFLLYSALFSPNGAYLLPGAAIAISSMLYNIYFEVHKKNKGIMIIALSLVAVGYFANFM